MKNFKEKDPSQWGKRKGGPLESTIENHGNDFANSLGDYHRKFSSPSHRSAPDQVYFFDNMVCMFIEYKRLGKEATKAQEEEHKKLRQRGFRVYVIDNKADAEQIIQRWHDYATSLTGQRPLRLPD